MKFFEKFYYDMNFEEKIEYHKEFERAKELNELAYDRTQYFWRVSEHDHQIAEHLVKICCFDNPDDLNGHYRSLNSWLKPKQNYKIKGGKITFDFLNNALWEGLCDSPEVLEQFTKELKQSKYKKVRLYPNIDYDILYNEITKVMTKVVNDMLEHKFNDIRDYLNPDNFAKYHD